MLLSLIAGFLFALAVSRHLRHSLIAVFLALWVVFLVPVGVGQAAETNLEESTTRLFELSPYVVNSLLGLVIPVLVALIVKAQASAKLKAAVNIVLAAVAALITAGLTENGSAVVSQDTFQNWVITTAVSVVTYLGFWKPVTAVNSHVAPSSGIG